MLKFRKKDYVISFFIVLVLMGSQIFPSENNIPVLIKILLSSVIASLVIGTMTNFLFKKRK
jgi:hypothetical protein